MMVLGSPCVIPTPLASNPSPPLDVEEVEELPSCLYILVGITQTFSELSAVVTGVHEGGPQSLHIDIHTSQQVCACVNLPAQPVFQLGLMGLGVPKGACSSS